MAYQVSLQMISKAVSVGGVGFADKTKPTQIRRSFEENFGLHKSIMNLLRKQPSAYSKRIRSVAGRCLEEKPAREELPS